jgi:hypothetical protein
MDIPPKAVSGALDNRPAGLGSDLQVVFRCPDCGANGRVSWKQLPQGMRCHACGGAFWIGGDGALHSERRAAKIHFRCQRCGSKQKIPVELIGHAAKCSSCGLVCDRTTLERYLPKPRESRKASTVSRVRKRRRWATLVLPRTALLLIALCVVLGIAGGIWTTASSSVVTLESRAEEFTRLCFARKMDAIGSFLSTQETAKFEAWLTLIGGPALSSDARPVEAQAKIISRTLSRAVIRLEVAGNSRGRTAHSQHWVDAGAGEWRFDAESTLRSMMHPSN